MRAPTACQFARHLVQIGKFFRRALLRLPAERAHEFHHLGVIFMLIVRCLHKLSQIEFLFLAALEMPLYWAEIAYSFFSLQFQSIFRSILNNNFQGAKVQIQPLYPKLPSKVA
jgi:hypothetical protein